jgi:hypothetical protein
MGDQVATAAVTTSGSDLSGTVSSGMFGSAPIEDGRIDGDKACWTLNISSPMQLTLKHEAVFAGDTVTGEVDLGMFGKSSFSGSRVS